MSSDTTTKEDPKEKINLDAKDLTESVNDFGIDTKCPICMDFYCDPVTFHCQHSFCRTCISGILEGDSEDWKCPTCRIPFVKPLPMSKNLFIESFVSRVMGPSAYKKYCNSRKDDTDQRVHKEAIDNWSRICHEENGNDYDANSSASESDPDILGLEEILDEKSDDIAHTITRHIFITSNPNPNPNRDHKANENKKEASDPIHKAEPIRAQPIQSSNVQKEQNPTNERPEKDSKESPLMTQTIASNIDLDNFVASRPQQMVNILIELDGKVCLGILFGLFISILVSYLKS